jgi:hypothetical protein
VSVWLSLKSDSEQMGEDDFGENLCGDEVDDDTGMGMGEHVGEDVGEDMGDSESEREEDEEVSIFRDEGFSVS